MAAPSFSYPVVVNQQTPGSAPILLFSAPVTDIRAWAGIPQRQRLERILEFADTMPDVRTSFVLKVEEDLREGRIDFS